MYNRPSSVLVPPMNTVVIYFSAYSDNICHNSKVRQCPRAKAYFQSCQVKNKAARRRTGIAVIPLLTSISHQ